MVLVVALVAMTCIFAVDAQASASKLSVGGSVGINTKATDLFGRGDYYRARGSQTGFTINARCDYKVTEDLSVTGILCFDHLFKNAFKYKEDFFAWYEHVDLPNVSNNFIGLFAGVSADLFTVGKVTVTGSVGPEFEIDLKTGKFDGLVTGVLKASYPVSDKVTVDLTYKGGVAYLVDNEFVKRLSELGFVYTDNVGTVGATYKF